MRRKAKKATQEEIEAFKKNMKSRGCHNSDGTHSKGDPCLCDFIFLNDTAMAELPHEELLKVAIQYRDTIMGLEQERNELTDAFRTLLDRNNILIKDVFGRKSERLAVLLEGSKPAGDHTPTEDDEHSVGAGNKGNTGEDSHSETPGKAAEKEEKREDKSEAEDGCDDPGHAPTQKHKKKRTWKPARSEGCLDKQCKDLPVIEKIIEMSEEELEKIFGKGNYRRMNSNDREIIEYKFTPSTLYVFKTVLCAYEAEDKDADCVKKEVAVAPNPVTRLRQCSRVTSSVWAFVLSQRYYLRLPWERVSSDLANSGLLLPPQMMEENARFFYGIFVAIIQRLWYYLLLTGHIQIDETPVLMYDQSEKLLRRCFFWVFTVSELYETDKAVTIFVYASGKGTDVLRKFLVEDHTYQGYATTDGHEPYHIIEEETNGVIRNTGCLNHFRTRLVRVLQAIPNLKEMTMGQLQQIPAFNALSELQVVFENEKKAAGMSADERTAYREEHVLPELEKSLDALAGLNADDYGQGSLMYKALTYLNNQQEYLKRFMEDGSIPLTNSNSERHIAFFSLLRNVSRLFGSDVMGKVGAGWETLAQTARAFTTHVDIYFQYLLDEAVPFIMNEDSKKGIKHTAKSNVDDLEKNALAYFNDERIDRFLPWSPEYKSTEKRILQERKETAQILAQAREDSG